MVPKLKTFIEEHIDLIEQKRWQALYSYATAEIPFQIGNLSYNLIKAGINLLEDLNRILPEMFCGADGLTELIIPSNITQIKRHAFKDCYQLEKLTLPTSLNDVDETSFKGCYELRWISYEGTTKEFIIKINPTTKMFWDTATGIINCSDGDVEVDVDGHITIKERT